MKLTVVACYGAPSRETLSTLCRPERLAALARAGSDDVYRVHRTGALLLASWIYGTPPPAEGTMPVSWEATAGGLVDLIVGDVLEREGESQ